MSLYAPTVFKSTPSTSSSRRPSSAAAVADPVVPIASFAHGSIKLTALDARRRYPNRKDGHEHEAHLQGLLGDIKRDTKSLYLHPRAKDSGHVFSTREEMHEHMFGRLQLTDTQLGELPSSAPKTPKQLANLLCLIGFGDCVEKVVDETTVAGKIFSVGVEEGIEEGVLQPYVTLLVSLLPSTKAIARNASLNKSWLIGPSRGETELILFLRVEGKGGEGYAVKVVFQVPSQ